MITNEAKLSLDGKSKVSYTMNNLRQKAAKRRVSEEVRHREPGWWKRARRTLLNMVSEPRTDCGEVRIGRDGSARYSARVCQYP